MQCTAIFDQPGSLCLVSVDFAFTAHQSEPMRGISDFVTAARRSEPKRGTGKIRVAAHRFRLMRGMSHLIASKI